MVRKKVRPKKRGRKLRRVAMHDDLVLLRTEAGEDLEDLLGLLPAKVECVMRWGENGALFPRSALLSLREALAKLEIAVRLLELGPEGFGR